MIFGTTPCCDEALVLDTPDKTPAWGSGPCKHCGALLWHYLSRIEPASYTEEDFLANFIVDHDARTVRRRGEAD